MRRPDDGVRQVWSRRAVAGGGGRRCHQPCPAPLRSLPASSPLLSFPFLLFASSHCLSLQQLLTAEGLLLRGGGGEAEEEEEEEDGDTVEATLCDAVS